MQSEAELQAKRTCFDLRSCDQLVYEWGLSYLRPRTPATASKSVLFSASVFPERHSRPSTHCVRERKDICSPCKLAVYIHNNTRSFILPLCQRHDFENWNDRDYFPPLLFLFLDELDDAFWDEVLYLSGLGTRVGFGVFLIYSTHYQTAALEYNNKTTYFWTTDWAVGLIGVFLRAVASVAIWIPRTISALGNGDYAWVVHSRQIKTDVLTPHQDIRTNLSSVVSC